MRAGIAVILFNTSARTHTQNGSESGGVLGVLEIGERLSLDLADGGDAMIDMPLCPPSDWWGAAL